MDYAQAERLNTAVRRIGMRHRARAAVLLAQLGLHAGQEVFLLDLADHGPRTQAQLAAAAGCEPPVVTVSARRLEAGGFVTRGPSPHDGRVTIVSLTPQGEAVIPQLKQLWRQLADETVAGLQNTSPTALLAALTDLADSLEQADQDTVAVST